MVPRTAQLLRRSAALVLTVTLLLMPAILLVDSWQITWAQGTDADGYYYTVQRGDTWSGVAWRTGISVADLKAFNPTAIHPYDWLWVGDRLFIPARPSSAPVEVTAGGYWYQVRAGDTWLSISQATGASLQDLLDANPLVFSTNGWVYIGQWVWIPAASGTLAPYDVATATPLAAVPEPTPTMTAMPSPSATITRTATVSATISTLTVTLTITGTRASTAITPTTSATATPLAATPTPTTTSGKPSATPTPTKATSGAAPRPTRPASCPATINDYADAIASYLNRSGNTAESLATWLTACGAIGEKQGAVTQAPIQSATSADVVVVLRDPADETTNPQGTLLVYHAGAKGYAMALKVVGPGALALLQVKDLNADGKPDVIWSDTTCGAHTCFGTLFVRSWNGTAYQSWLASEPTIAYPEYSFQETVAGGSGQEILIHGGVISSAGAGPQRAWTETYVSPEGDPYRLYSQVYDPSDCLYHHLLDANQAFNAWTSKGFAPAIAAYQAALSGQKLKACGAVPDELAKLRDFIRFRLVVSQVAAGQSAQAGAAKTQIGSTALLGAANTFLDSYKASGSVVQACRDTTTYAAANLSAWDFLADWGYANPSFTAQDLCPLGQ